MKTKFFFLAILMNFGIVNAQNESLPSIAVANPNVNTVGIKQETAAKMMRLELIKINKHKVYDEFDGYFGHITNFIDQMDKVFNFGNDYGIYIHEVKYLSPEPLVNYTDLSLNEYPNVHFVGDALSARGITVSGAHGIYVAEALLS
jgi:7-cyano-7-deazaguanine synthase in queuosine biosynthesis